MLAQSVQVNNSIIITPCLSPSFIFLPATLPYSSSPPPFFFLAFLFSLSLSIHHLSTCSSHSFFLAVSFLSLTISLFFPFVHLLFSLHSLLPPSYHSFVYICLPVYAAIFLSYPSSLSLLSSCPPSVFLFFLLLSITYFISFISFQYLFFHSFCLSLFVPSVCTTSVSFLTVFLAFSLLYLSLSQVLSSQLVLPLPFLSFNMG